MEQVSRMRVLKSIITEPIESDLFEVEPTPMTCLQDTVQCLESKVLSTDNELTEVKHLVLLLKNALPVQETDKHQSDCCEAFGFSEEYLTEEGPKNIFCSNACGDISYKDEQNQTEGDLNLLPEKDPIKRKVPPLQENKKSDYGRQKISTIQRLLIAALSLLSSNDEVLSQDEETDMGRLHSEEEPSDLTASDWDDVIFVPVRFPPLSILDSFKSSRMGTSARNKQMGECPAYWKYGHNSNRPLKTVTPVKAEIPEVEGISPSVAEAAAAPMSASNLKLMRSI